MTEEQPPESDGVEDLLEFVRDSRGFDFSGYKRTSLTRRIQRRMGDVGATSFTDYRDVLETDSDEFERLFNTILINVTSFFREPTAWQHLQESILPDLVATVPADKEIRVWSAGCSSGEEAYSLAMLFAELLGIPECVRRVKIYGTDVDDEALQQARSGRYAPKALESLPQGYRERYFEAHSANYVFRPDLRRRVIFGRNDLTRDAPISRLHLLACRNTLMYFNAETQRRIIDRFHFALLPGAYLFLGKSETLLSDGERFETATMRHRIFMKRVGGGDAALQPTGIRLQSSAPYSAWADERRRLLVSELIESIPSPVIALDRDDSVLLINGQARTVLGLMSQDVGRRFSDLHISYRPMELRALVERSKSERRSFRVDPVEFHLPGEPGTKYFEILMQPLLDDGNLVGTAVIFIDATRKTVLEDELRSSRENLETVSAELQSSNEELETTNEELQSSIEELETTNEELQSTNEELETTNEELQSTNEELETTNEEMRTRTTEMDELRGFLEGVLDSIDASVIVLDINESILSWSRGAQEMWGLRPDEVIGKPFFSIDFGLPTEALREAARTCATTQRPAELVGVQAINRRGHVVVCTVRMSPLGDMLGTVLLIEVGAEDTPAERDGDA